MTPIFPTISCPGLIPISALIFFLSKLKSNFLKSTPAEIDFTLSVLTPETDFTISEIASPLVMIFLGIWEYNKLFGNTPLMGIEMWRLRTTGRPNNLEAEPTSQLSIELWV